MHTSAITKVRQHIFEWWYLVPEPRIMSMVTTFLYMTAFLTGIVTLVNPSRALSTVLESGAVITVGWLFVLGSIVGMVFGAADFWQFERWGIFAIMAGLLIYGLCVVIFSDSAQRWTYLGVVLLATIGLVYRLAHIYRYPFKPTTGPIKLIG